MQDFNFNIGGPIMKDRLWFFSTVRHVSVDEGVGNSFYRDYLDIQDPAQAGDPSIQHQYVRDALLRLTYQMTPKNKFSSYFERIWKHKDPELLSGYNPITASEHPRPQARALLRRTGQDHLDADQQAAVRGWLFDQHRAAEPAYQPAIEEVAAHPFTVRLVRGAVTHPATNGNICGAEPGGSTGTYPDRKVFSGALSYVTGSHSMKVGVAVVVRRRRQLADRATAT